MPLDFGKEQVNFGDFASLTSSVHKGDLPITISWLLNNISIKYSDGILVSKIGKKVSMLTIESSQENHAGVYTCFAQNRAGSAMQSSSLHVNGINIEQK